MSRKPREISPYNIYHVMMRGINKQQIFYDSADYRLFEFLLSRYKEKCGYELIAYCLMGNHVHLLIKANDEPIGDIIKHIGASFVYWYNLKYERVGHLFQDRFKSEPVNSAVQLLTVLRYILNNPVKAGLCAKPEEYQYSSAKEYLLGKSGISDQDLIRSFTNEQSLRDYLIKENNDKCMDYEEKTIIRRDDKSAKRMIVSEFGTNPPVVENERDMAILYVSIRRLSNSGISIRQLSRLSGIPKKVIEKALKK